ncbi:MAG: peptidoglycan DD-metalloendopeptidase family protein [Moorellaceae bacterium]
MAFLAMLLAGAYYLVTNDAVFRGGKTASPTLPLEGPASPVAKPLPREPLSGSETVPSDLKDKSGVYPAAATQEEATPAAREKENMLVLVRPVKGKALASFGFAWAPAFGEYRFHPGLDLEGQPGEDVIAACAGTVSLVEYGEDWRYRVTIQGDNGYQIVYAHLDAVKAPKGSQVKAGEIIGTLGLPGRLESGNPVHLHLEVSKDGQPIDPAPYLQ